ncbi:MAG: hypothetical protein AB7V46_04980 [Thermomicrobiales bacterium]
MTHAAMSAMFRMASMSVGYRRRCGDVIAVVHRLMGAVFGLRSLFDGSGGEVVFELPAGMSLMVLWGVRFSVQRRWLHLMTGVRMRGALSFMRRMIVTRITISRCRVITTLIVIRSGDAHVALPVMLLRPARCTSLHM